MLTIPPSRLAGRLDTHEHILLVSAYLLRAAEMVLRRVAEHDRSKLLPPEAAVFEASSTLLAGVTYGSPEYERLRLDLGSALSHHYAVNRHHPEHWPEGVRGMDLLDLLEMTCDWLASCTRHADGDIQHSLFINQRRFDYSDDLAAILANTVRSLQESDR